MDKYIQQSARRFVESHQTGGQHWPDAAVFAVKYCMPVLAGKRESKVDFFLSKEYLDAWLADEGQRVEAYQAYEWDLGPNPMPGVYKAPGELPLTAAEKGVR